MPRVSRAIAALATLAALMGATHASAATNAPVLNCNIDVTYQLTNAGTVFDTQTYSRSFAVSDAAPFNDDFSTVTRIKTFRATSQTSRGISVVTVDFFDDVGVFSTISFGAQVAVVNGLATTSGNLGYSSTLGVAGNHDTRYVLTCMRR